MNTRNAVIESRLQAAAYFRRDGMLHDCLRCIEYARAIRLGRREGEDASWPDPARVEALSDRLWRRQYAHQLAQVQP